MSTDTPTQPDLARRAMLQTAAAGLLGAAMPHDRASAATTAPGATAPVNPLAGQRPIWKLERPAIALPDSYFWTWDHSTNWMMDDAGMLNFGCNNRYLKRPETYLEDYRRLTDMAAGLGVKGIVIWGFLRDSHGGVEYAKRVSDYAASRGVSIMPGIGTTWYGGAYYEGDHRYNLETFVKRYPEARRIDEKGNFDPHGMCPTHPGFVQWLQDGIRWLFKEFAIGGANLENGDFVVCHCPRCKARQEEWPKEPVFWFHQYLGYEPALQALREESKNKLITWATYKGFVPGIGQEARDQAARMECERPALFDRLPTEPLCQWTLTFMTRPAPLPLLKYLDDGAPQEISSGPNWPAGIKPPSRRSVGFLHQGSQWCGRSRYMQVIGTIKEGCLCAHRTGLEGVSIHGEVSSLHVPYALNYLAFSHFLHWPGDSLRQFGRKTLGQVLGKEDEGEAFVEQLAHVDSGAPADTRKKDITQRCDALRGSVSHNGEGLVRYRFWNWLDSISRNEQDRQTVSFF